MTEPDQAGGQADDGLTIRASSVSIPYSNEAIFKLEGECGAQLETYLRRRLRDDPDTVRVVERCWVDLVRKWQRQGELVEPRALLFRLAHFRATDRIRQILGHHEEPHDQGLLDDAAAQVMRSPGLDSKLAVSLDVRAALADLPARQHRAVLLVYGYGLEYRDAAAILACTVDTVGNMLRAAKATLKQSPRLVGYQVSSPTSPSEVHQ